MFGVLVVKNNENKIGYLAAFSGKLADNSLPEKFVPPVFNMRTDGSFYLKGEKEIDKLNKRLTSIKQDITYVSLKKSIQKISKEITTDLTLERKKLTLRKFDRKVRKKNSFSTLTNSAISSLNKKLVQESFNDQFYYRELQEYYQKKIKKEEEKIAVYKEEIASLKKQRKEKSNYLQQTLFSKYAFLNKDKKQKNLLDIFNNPSIKPPAGSGECSAPKLLQYAFLTNLTPILFGRILVGNFTKFSHKKA